MYSISSLTNSQNKTSSKAIGGLATGLDTAELIKNLTVGTRSKIAKQQQTKQLLNWQTEAYRGVSDKLVNLSRKYTSFASNSNLMSSSFYTSSNFTTTGENASKVTVSGSSNAASQLSIVSATKASNGGAVVNASEFLTANANMDLSNTKLDALIGKSINFTLNSTSKDVTFTADDVAALKSLPSGDRNEALKNLLQGKLDASFGANAVAVSLSSSKLQFKTANIGSTFKVSNISQEGIDALGIVKDQANRLNLNSKLSNFGITNGSSITIGGSPITFEVKDTSTVADLFSAINSKTSETGVSVRYIESLNKFEFATTKNSNIQVAGDIGTKLFGGTVDVLGKTDATLSVKYADGDVIKLSSANNSFSVDGLTINVNESFSTGSAIGLNASADTNKIFDSIKNMIKDYNEIVEHINKEHSTKPNRNFQPLSDEQRKELSEDEAKKWDEKAKTGMLFGNSDIGNLKNDLRKVFSFDSSTLSTLKEIGITPSPDWKDGGTIVIDEEKLKKSISENPENIKDIFAKPKSGTDMGGIMVKLKTVTDKYAKTEGSTRGVLIEKAGSTFSPLSMTKNILFEQNKKIDKIILNLNKTLANEETRYNRQFSNLEVVYSKMNAQAGWLTQQFGG